MRSIYNVLQKLRDQERRDKHLRFSEAEQERTRQEEELHGLRGRLSEERQRPPTTAGMMILSEFLNMQRHLNIQSSETLLEQQTTIVEQCREELLKAQMECKVMEEVISSIKEKEEKEYDRKVGIINDELGALSWRRRR